MGLLPVSRLRGVVAMMSCLAQLVLPHVVLKFLTPCLHHRDLVILRCYVAVPISTSASILYDMEGQPAHLRQESEPASVGHGTVGSSCFDAQDLVATDSWAWNPTYNRGNPYKTIARKTPVRRSCQIS